MPYNIRKYGAFNAKTDISSLEHGFFISPAVLNAFCELWLQVLCHSWTHLGSWVVTRTFHAIWHGTRSTSIKAHHCTYWVAKAISFSAVLLAHQLFPWGILGHNLFLYSFIPSRKQGTAARSKIITFLTAIEFLVWWGFSLVVLLSFWWVFFVFFLILLKSYPCPLYSWRNLTSPKKWQIKVQMSQN